MKSQLEKDFCWVFPYPTLSLLSLQEYKYDTNMIQSRLDELKPFFKGMKVAEHFRIVEFNLKRGWLIPDNEKIDVQQKEIKENNGELLYNMFYSESKTFDEILTFVEEDVISHNLELEQKEELLRVKVEELKRVFEDTSLVELNSLKFTTEDNSLKLGTNKKTTKEDKDHKPKIQPEYLKEMDNNKNKVKQNGSTKEFSKNS